MRRIYIQNTLTVLLLLLITSMNAQNTYDTAPIFGKGKVSLTSFIELYCIYPEKAASEKKEGTVILNIAINEKGENGKISVKQSVSKEIDDEAIRVANLFPDWTPAKKGGKPIASEKEVPFIFQLSGLESTSIGAQKNPLFIVNDKKITGNINVDPNTITSIRVMKGISATKKYGEDGKDGVIIITTR